MAPTNQNLIDMVPTNQNLIESSTPKCPPAATVLVFIHPNLWFYILGISYFMAKKYVQRINISKLYLSQTKRFIYSSVHGFK